MGKSTFKRVRYLRISTNALELVNLFPSDSQKAKFLRIIQEQFKRLEAGEELEEITTDDLLFDTVMRMELEEMEDGFRVYSQNATGNKKGSGQQRSTSDLPVVSSGQQRSTSGNSRVEEGKEIDKENRVDYESINHAWIDMSQRAEIEKRLKDLGIDHADPGFWNTCFVYGYDSVDYALAKAGATGNNNLKYITGMIANGINK